MKNISNFEIIELSIQESKCINGGGPIVDGILDFYRTMGSFYKGLYDGLVGNEPAA